MFGLAPKIDSLSNKTNLAVVKMMSLMLLVAMMLAMVLCNPIVLVSTHVAAINNTLAAASSPVLFKFNPGIVDAMCTGVYATKLSVQYTSDDFTISDHCRDFLNLMGGLKAKTDVDAVIICSGTPPKGTGEDEDKLKLMFFVTGTSIAEKEAKGTQWIDVLLQATSIPKNKVVATSALVGVNVNDKDEFTISQLTC